MKKWVLCILIAAIAVLAALTAVLAVLYARLQPPHIQLEGGAELPFEAENLLPGESETCEYDLRGQPGYIGISFTQGEEDGLFSFIHVRIEADGAALYSGALADIEGALWAEFDGDALLSVEYSLPLETGNEAQQQKLVLLLSLTLTNALPQQNI